MSIMVCDRCSRYVDTDFDEIVEVNDGDEFWCLPCHDAEFQRQHDYWKPLYDGEKLAGLLNMEDIQ